MQEVQFGVAKMASTVHEREICCAGVRIVMLLVICNCCCLSLLGRGNGDFKNQGGT